MPKGKLTPKQERFVEEYLIDCNGTQAAIRAGYSVKGAEVTASKLLTNPKVVLLIAAGKAKRSERTQVTSDMILSALWSIWDAKISDILTNDFRLKPLDEWPDVWQRMCSNVDVKSLNDRPRNGDKDAWNKIGEAIKTRTADPLTALIKAGEHVMVKAFPQRALDINVNIDLNEITERLMAGRQRSKKEAEHVH